MRVAAVVQAGVHQQLLEAEGQALIAVDAHLVVLLRPEPRAADRVPPSPVRHCHLAENDSNGRKATVQICP